MQIVTRDPTEFANLGLRPQTGTATVVPGIGAFLDTSVLQELVASPDGLARLMALLVALKEAEALEEEAEAEDMVSAWPKDTGLPNAIKIIPGNPEHGPRIKVALNPSDRFSANGESAYIPFGEAPGSFEQPRAWRSGRSLPSAALLRDLHAFIEMNRADLYAFDRDPDQGGISGAELIRRLRKLPSRR